MEELFARPEPALRAAAGIAGFALALSSLEWLSLRREFRPGRYLSWQLSGSRPFLLRHPRLGEGLGRLFDAPGVVVLIGLRLLAGALLAVGAIAEAPLTVPLVLAAVVAVTFHQRFVHGMDGSDLMVLAIVIGLALGTLLGVEALAVTFVAAQAVLSYFIAGVAKLRGPAWRSGEAVPLVMSTRNYGTPAIGELLREHRLLGRGVSWATVAFECAFPLALIAPEAVFLAFLAAGALFHLGSAVVMGLNVFPWAFIATYPCLIYLWQQL